MDFMSCLEGLERIVWTAELAGISGLLSRPGLVGELSGLSGMAETRGMGRV